MGGGTDDLRQRGTAPRNRSGFRLRMAFALDVVGYGARTVPQGQQVERRLRRLVDAALDSCKLKLDPEIVEHQWTGDGINAVLPADIDPTVILPLLIRSLATALAADNAQSTDRIRLRMAVSAGLIERTVAGFSGQLIVDINRLVDNSALRGALVDAPACDLGVAISDHVYGMVVRPGYSGIPGGQFTHMNVVAKEFSGSAWLWLSTRQWTQPAYLPLTSEDPDQVGGYRIYARLGASAAGVVYLGGPASSDIAGDGPEPDWVAVKVLDQTLAADTDTRRRLAAGALAAGVLPDPHLASVIASDPVAPRPWVASTLVRGPSLADTVTQTGPLPSAAVGWTALGLARAAATLHQAGLTHRAITPRNVLLDGHGPMLTDFGVNRAALAFGPGSAADDVFGLGYTICYAATGRAPWPDYPADPIPSAAATAPPGDIDLAGCPAELVQIVFACLAADPARRPTADRLVGWLADVADQRPGSWLPTPVAGRLRDYQELPPPRSVSWPRFRWGR
jgi:hypothetical protein